MIKVFWGSLYTVAIVLKDMSKLHWSVAFLWQEKKKLGLFNKILQN